MLTRNQRVGATLPL